MQITCGRCERTIEFSGESPRFCSHCGQSLTETDPDLDATRSFHSTEGSVAFEASPEEARLLKEYDTINYSSVYTTPTIANRRMFITDRTRLYVVELDEE